MKERRVLFLPPRFTALCAAELRAEASITETIRSAKELYRGLALDGRPGAAASARAAAPAMCFNYHGRLGDGPEAPTRLSSPAPPGEADRAALCDVHPGNSREYLLEVEGLVLDDASEGEGGHRLAFEWIYSPEHVDAGKLRVWAEAFVDEVAQVVAHCAEVLQAPASFRRLTPSDFPLLRGVGVQELDALVAGMAGAAGQGGSITPEAIEDIYPCTPLQEGLLMETMLDRTANVEQLTLRLKGPLDRARWRAAWTAMARRHGILRTRLVPRAGASGSARQDGATFLQVSGGDRKAETEIRLLARARIVRGVIHSCGVRTESRGFGRELGSGAGF